MTCKHPPNRLSSWFAYNSETGERDILCVACNACGESLKGHITEQEEAERRERNERIRRERDLASEVQSGNVRFYIAGRPIKK